MSAYVVRVAFVGCSEELTLGPYPDWSSAENVRQRVSCSPACTHSQVDQISSSSAYVPLNGKGGYARYGYANGADTYVIATSAGQGSMNASDRMKFRVGMHLVLDAVGNEPVSLPFIVDKEQGERHKEVMETVRGLINTVAAVEPKT